MNMKPLLSWVLGLLALTAVTVALAIYPRTGHADTGIPVWGGTPPSITAPPTDVAQPHGVKAPKGIPPRP